MAWMASLSFGLDASLVVRFLDRRQSLSSKMSGDLHNE
jgi:hypothetical protein